MATSSRRLQEVVVLHEVAIRFGLPAQRSGAASLGVKKVTNAAEMEKSWAESLVVNPTCVKIPSWNRISRRQSGSYTLLALGW